MCVFFNFINTYYDDCDTISRSFDYEKKFNYDRGMSYR